MTSPRFCITKGLSVVFLIFLYGVLSLAHGQQTIFNVPTTDVLDKGKVYLEDLRFLASVGLAHFIVWRTLRRRYRENSARRREFKLLWGNGSLAQPEQQVARRLDWRANAVANANRNLRPAR